MINYIRSNTHISQVQTSKVNSRQRLANELREKYNCLRNGYVRLSPAYIKKCENDPEKRLELQKTLAFLEQYQKEEVKKANEQGIRINSSSIEVDADGNVGGGYISTTRSSDRGYVNNFNTETGARSSTSYAIKSPGKSVSLSDKILKDNREHIRDFDRKREQARIEKRRLELREDQMRMQQRILSNKFLNTGDNTNH